MRLGATALHAIGLCGLSLAVAACDGATEVVSDACGVAITMPGPPTHQTFDTPIDGGRIGNHQYRVLVDGVLYDFICTPAPGLLEGSDPKDLLNYAKEAFLGPGIRLLAERSVKLGEHQGLELKVARPDEVVRNQTYVFQNATLSVSATARSDTLSEGAVQGFFDSLRVAVK